MDSSTQKILKNASLKMVNFIQQKTNNLEIESDDSNLHSLQKYRKYNALTASLN